MGAHSVKFEQDQLDRTLAAVEGINIGIDNAFTTLRAATILVSDINTTAEKSTHILDEKLTQIHDSTHTLLEVIKETREQTRFVLHIGVIVLVPFLLCVLSILGCWSGAYTETAGEGELVFLAVIARVFGIITCVCFGVLWLIHIPETGRQVYQKLTGKKSKKTDKTPTPTPHTQHTNVSVNPAVQEALDRDTTNRQRQTQPTLMQSIGNAIGLSSSP
eukprot:GDKI01040896.1.p1 GENE.GDKI01040896.1~~GDKI01040896.1.p1  ORF type:complete len:218 (+),score=55.24 GDKI01040896.1:116-769(+)